MQGEPPRFKGRNSINSKRCVRNRPDPFRLQTARRLVRTIASFQANRGIGVNLYDTAFGAGEGAPARSETCIRGTLRTVFPWVRFTNGPALAICGN